MKRVEVKLSLPVVAPLLDVIKQACDPLKDQLAMSTPSTGVDADIVENWTAELLESQERDIRTLLALFDSEFFATGVIGFDEDNAEAVVRACAAVRLRLRGQNLKSLTDEMLESGDVQLAQLEETVRKGFMGYLFLATIQEVIIQHLDSSIIDS